MTNLETRNQKIIDAVIAKAAAVCPDSLALIGIYGSFLTGDIHEKSDLDLLIVINDDQGWQLSATFLQEDLQVGHDIYCTTWESLEQDSTYPHPNISKLMDSRIVYCADDKHLARLEELRAKARAHLAAPFSCEDYEKAEGQLKEAEHAFVAALAAQDLVSARARTGETLYYLENAIAMLNKYYFRYGTRRIFQELENLAKKPEHLREMIEAVVSAASPEEIQTALGTLVTETARIFRQVKSSLATERQPVTADALQGTYEEMYSNWRNKMYLAAETGDRHLAYMSLISLNAMLADISGEVAIGDYHAMVCYDPKDLRKTAENYDAVLQQYSREYEKAGLAICRYPDIDDFINTYINK